jgi:hypothetical protein
VKRGYVFGCRNVPGGGGTKVMVENQGDETRGRQRGPVSLGVSYVITNA